MDRRHTLKIVKDDQRYVWHPFTQMAEWTAGEPSEPLVIDRGEGNYLIDTRGRRYLDGVSSLWVTLHGHRKRAVDAAVKRQLDKLAHSTFLGLTHEPAVRLAKELINSAPGELSRVFYSDNGSTSVEVALKMAYQYWAQGRGETKRSAFLSLRNAYHGDTIGSVSVGGMELFHGKFRPLLFKNYFAPSPYCYRCGCAGRPCGGREKGAPRGKTDAFTRHTVNRGCRGECLAGVEKILKQHGSKIAAAIVEPMVQGAAGMLTMPPGYLKRFEGLVRRAGILLICDEVATGFGRTGKMFAVEHEGIRPDLLCLSKGITAGYLPLAATLTTEKVYRAFLGKHEEFKTFFHGHTYTANPLACAAALANLAIFRKEKVIEGLAAKIDHFARELESLKDLPVVGEVRRIGLMTGIEVVKDRATGKDFPVKDKIGARICAACRPHGLIIRPLGNVIVLMPPLSITKAELSRMVATVRQAIIDIALKSVTKKSRMS